MPRAISLRVFEQTEEAVTSGKDGLIGGAFLRQFQVVFDLPSSNDFGTEQVFNADEFNMSGMALKWEGENYKLLRVYAINDASPAAEAGLQAKEVSHGNQRQTYPNFSTERSCLDVPKRRRKYLLHIKRGKKELQVKLKLKRLI